METLDIRGVFLTRLCIRVWVIDELVSIQVYAPKLQYFHYTGPVLDSLFFPAIAPEQIHLRLELEKPIDSSFFLKLREVLNFQTNFKIKVTYRSPEKVLPVDIDVNDVRRRVPIPATTVQQIYFLFPGESFWESAPLFDTFFSICHPKYVKARQLRKCTMPGNTKYFWKKIVTGMIERKTIKKYWPDLEDIEIKHPVAGKWKTLTSSWICFAEQDRVKFRLTWCSP
uniref:uncharacterized protein LOC122605435 n=1 Tax=Erigeron canadensis TaxID=72917 RepID=UPI001CB96CD2|nr:uncharacterized protein LOC122605435 [Erigeron canadensis]